MPVLVPASVPLTMPLISCDADASRNAIGHIYDYKSNVLPNFDQLYLRNAMMLLITPSAYLMPMSVLMTSLTKNVILQLILIMST